MNENMLCLSFWAWFILLNTRTSSSNISLNLFLSCQFWPSSCITRLSETSRIALSFCTSEPFLCSQSDTALNQSGPFLWGPDRVSFSFDLTLHHFLLSISLSTYTLKDAVHSLGLWCSWFQKCFPDFSLFPTSLK
jgi:hypothetical protein